MHLAPKHASVEITHVISDVLRMRAKVPFGGTSPFFLHYRLYTRSRSLPNLESPLYDNDTRGNARVRDGQVVAQ